MLMYWSMFVAPAFLSLGEPLNARLNRNRGALLCLFALIWLIVAFRENGGDYERYVIMFNLIRQQSFQDAMTLSDPGYSFLNWASNQLGLELYGVNAVCAALFLTGLFKFANSEPKPLLVLAIAVPYLIIVAAMGYTRQGTAVGLVIYGLHQTMNRQLIGAIIAFSAAALFHSSAGIVLPIAYYAQSVRRGSLQVRLLMLAAITYAAWSFASTRSSDFLEYYVESDHYQSQGALIRSVMSAGAAVVFFAFRRRWFSMFTDGPIWQWFAIAALISVPMSLVASTAVDRVGLYIIPLQLVAFGRLPYFMNSAALAQAAVTFVVLLYTIALIIWLHFGNYAAVLWVPYRSAIFGTLS